MIVSLVFVAALTRVPLEVRAQALGVVCFATIGEVTGSLVWGVYHYRLQNLPLFVPPAHGLVYLAGLSLATALRAHTRALVAAAAAFAAGWGLLGLTVLPRRDVAGAIGVPLLLLFLWRGRNRAIYAAVFLVVASLELYGTAIGTWRWARDLPGLGIPDGNPPSASPPATSGSTSWRCSSLRTSSPSCGDLAERPMSFARRRSLSDMKLLLTSAGIKNPTIQEALVELLGKPISESDALCIPTALYGHPSRPAPGVEVHQRQRAGTPMSDWAGSRWASSSSLRCPASTRSAGFRWSARPTSCSSTVATPPTCATGCASPASPTSSRRSRDRLGRA